MDNWGFTVEGSNVYAKDQPGNSVEFCIGNCIFSSRFRQGHCRARSENPGGSQQSEETKLENLRYRNLIGRVALAGSHTIHFTASICPTLAESEIHHPVTQSQYCGDTTHLQ